MLNTVGISAILYSTNIFSVLWNELLLITVTYRRNYMATVHCGMALCCNTSSFSLKGPYIAEVSVIINMVMENML